jgi:hypothetical protein
MTTYTLAPGAWLSGSALHPNLRSRAASDAGLHPNLQPPISRKLLADDQPWRGTDPGWVYDGGAAALLAQALERTHARIVRPVDPRWPATAAATMRAAAGAVNIADPLWRWGSAFRVQAVVADLAWRLRVEQCVLKLTVGGAVSLDLQPCAALQDAFFEDQIDKVQRAAIEREDRLPEILAQSDDFRVFFRVLLGLDAAASPLLAEVLAVAWQWATPLVMALKNDVAALRPVQRAPGVLPVLATPAHGSLPSGHATMATLTADILSQLLFDGQPDHPRVRQMDRLARRIAFNRVVAGVHFPVDSAAGYALGLRLAGHFVGWATGKRALEKLHFNPQTHAELTETGPRPVIKRQPTSDGKSALLARLWDAAKREGDGGGA